MITHNKEIITFHRLGKIVKYLLLFIIFISSIIDNTRIMNMIIVTLLGTVSAVVSSFISSVKHEFMHNKNVTKPNTIANITNITNLEKVISITDITNTAQIKDITVIGKIIRVLT
jgi:hypothetical protein